MLVFLGAIYTYSEDNSYESSIGDIVVGVWVELAELHLIEDALLCRPFPFFSCYTVFSSFVRGC